MVDFGPGDVGFFDRVAGVYDRLMPSASAAELRAGLAAADRPVERVLDVGGGTGRAAAAVDADLRVVCDRSRGMLARVADRDPAMAAVECDAGRLPVGDAAVDAVLVVDALHHLPDQAAAVREAARVLAPGGVLVVRDFDPSALVGGAVGLGERLLGMGSRFRTPRETADLAAAAGLDPSVRTGRLGYTVVAAKGESH